VDEWLKQEKDPRLLNALRLDKALVLARLHRYQELLDLDRIWSQAAPDSPVPHSSVIELLSEQKQHDWAIKLARDWAAQQEAVAATGQKAPQIDEARASLSRALLLAGKEKEALELARQQAEKAPKDAATLRNLYVVQATIGRMADAEQVLEAIYRLNPDDPTINNDLGYQYAEHGIYLGKAEELVRKALELRPNEPAFRDSLGWVLYKQGRFQDAWVQFEPFVSMEDAHLAVCFDHAGDTAWRLGKNDQAISLWERAVKSAKGEQRKDTDTKRVLEQTPRKLTQARQGKSVNVAPLGQGVSLKE
jgi:Flp pilus assembly protein TadD